MTQQTEVSQKREKPQKHQPGREHAMEEKPIFIRPDYRGSNKLAGKVAVITGGDSGIGRAVAVHFAREGCDLALVYLEESRDAEDTRALVEDEGIECALFKGDVGDPEFCQTVIDSIIERFGKLDILVNNAAEQHEQKQLQDISQEQLLATFRTNIFGYFNMMKSALPELEEGGRIINTSSVTAHRGNPVLADYSSTKGAIESLTRSVAPQVAERGITVNCVAPGPIWTPLIPASFDKKALEEFGKSTLFKRPGQPCEVAPAYVYLASADGDYVTGQTIHINGGGYLGI